MSRSDGHLRCSYHKCSTPYCASVQYCSFWIHSNSAQFNLAGTSSMIKIVVELKGLHLWQHPATPSCDPGESHGRIRLVKSSQISVEHFARSDFNIVWTPVVCVELDSCLCNSAAAPLLSLLSSKQYPSSLNWEPSHPAEISFSCRSGDGDLKDPWGFMDVHVFISEVYMPFWTLWSQPHSEPIFSEYPCF